MSRRGNGASRRVTVLTAALLGVAVGAGTIAGCASDEPEPQPQQEQDKPEPAPEPEPTEEETPAGPELPDKLDTDYVRTVLQYYDEYNKSFESGRPDGFLALSHDDCVSCKGMADVLEDTYADGGRFEGELEPVIDSDKNLVRQGSDTTANVSMRFRQDSVVLHPGDGSEAEPSETTYIDAHVNLIREGNQWLIHEISTDEVDE